MPTEAMRTEGMPSPGKILVISIAVFSLALLYSTKSMARDPVEPFLSECEKKIASTWQEKSLSDFQIPPHFRRFAKGVVGFVIDDEGKPGKIRIKHSSRESLIVAARTYYGQRGDGLMNAMDNAMIEAIKNSSPLPSPPRQLNSHRRYAVIFDTQRFKPLRMFIDDQVPTVTSLEEAETL